MKFLLVTLVLLSAVQPLCGGEEITEDQNATRTFIPRSLEVPEFTPPAPPVTKEVPVMRVDSAITVPSTASRNVTLIRAEASTLPDLPAPALRSPQEPKVLTQEDIERMAEQRRHRLQLGAFVFDHRVSVVHWQHPDTGESYQAACGFDIGLLEGIGQFVSDGETYSVMLMSSNYDTERFRVLANGMFPNLPDVAPNSIVFLRGNPQDPVGTAPVTLLKDLIVTEKVRLVAFQAARFQFHQAAAEWERAHPPIPRDETFWFKPHRGSRYLANPRPETSVE